MEEETTVRVVGRSAFVVIAELLVGGLVSTFELRDMTRTGELMPVGGVKMDVTTKRQQ